MANLSEMTPAERLNLWQERTDRSSAAFDAERTKMDDREKTYRGRADLKEIIADDTVIQTACPWNIVFELIEAQVDSNIPMAKVSPLRKEDEKLARMIEDLCVNKLDELPSELINDQLERTVPKQGGGLVHVEWDNEFKESNRDGRSTMSFVHPKNLVPQPGVTSDLEDMDWVGIDIGVTKSYVMKRWGIDVSAESEEAPELRGPGEVDSADDMVTVRLRYYKNDTGGIGKYVYCNDTELEFYDDYQARRNKKCSKCGRPKQLVMSGAPATTMAQPTLDGTYPGGGEWTENADGMLESENARFIPDVPVDDNVCPWCGGTTWIDGVDEYEEVWQAFDITDDDGNVVLHIDGQHYEAGEDGIEELVPTKIPYYVPNAYPVILMQNISAWGQLLGESDIDKISPQQNAINRLNQKMLDSILSGGSVVTLPADPSLETNNGELRQFRLEDIADREKFGVYNIQADISQTVHGMNLLYEQARNTIGITDSFQGREDSTAQSGAAKQISADQAAGRFASKRVMKKFFWSRVYEMLFKFELAYSDSRRPIIGRDKNGMHRDEVWNRYLFLHRNEDTGEYYWNTDFLFSVDTGAAALVTNRSQMWRELYEYFTAGALGAREDIKTQIRFWRMLEFLHYPHAGDIKAQLIEQNESESEITAAAALEKFKALMGNGGDQTV